MLTQPTLAEDDDDPDFLMHTSGLSASVKQVNESIIEQTARKQKALDMMADMGCPFGRTGSVHQQILRFEAEVKKCQVAYNSTVRQGGAQIIDLDRGVRGLNLEIKPMDRVYLKLKA